MGRLSPGQIVFLAFIALLLFSGGDPRLLTNPGRLGSQVTGLLISAAAIILAITVHEANHAFVAVSLGDETPRRMGRLSLNPLRHLDPLGTLLLFVAHFGWGKPVMFNPRNLRINPLLGSAAVSFAGPLANILFAIVLNLFLTTFGTSIDPLARSFLSFLLRINILLGAFNLVPIPPLDGFGVVQGLLPPRLAYALEPLRQYGPIILLAAIFLPRMVGGPDMIGFIMDPLIDLISTLVGVQQR
jgi:Zn-dependent protease